jgi:tripartite-type tricarboxylate transporter receptor subunit TctC
MGVERRHFLRLAVGAATLPAVSRVARAQTYPNKLIKLILPFLPGTPNDVIARLIAPSLSSRLGQTVVVDNRPGGGTSLGTKAVMAAEPDGYTLLLTSSNVHVIGQTLNRNIIFDPIKDFTSVATVATTSWVLVIASTVPVKSLEEFVTYAKANPGKMNIGFGQGTGPQLVGELFKKVTGTNIANIPYKGSTQAITDMLGGQIQVNFGTTANLLPLIREGKLRALAVTSRTRSPDYPEVPTMIESGFPALSLSSTVVILAPARTPPNIIDRLNSEVNESLKSSELATNLLKTGYKPKVESPQNVAAFLADEIQKWLPIARETGFSID